MLRQSLAIAWLLLVPLAALGSAVRFYSEADMSRAAAVIARGQVAQVQVRRHPSGMIVTDVTVAIARGLKGLKTGETLTFTLLGGTLNGATVHVAGTSRYQVGEEVLVFLEQGGDGLVEMGIGAGKYQVVRKGRGARVTRVWGGAQAMQADVNGVAQPILPPASIDEPLDDFEMRILAQVQE